MAYKSRKGHRAYYASLWFFAKGLSSSMRGLTVLSPLFIIDSCYLDNLTEKAKEFSHARRFLDLRDIPNDESHRI